jgi:hypothetical protein
LQAGERGDEIRAAGFPDSLDLGGTGLLGKPRTGGHERQHGKRGNIARADTTRQHVRPSRAGPPKRSALGSAWIDQTERRRRLRFGLRRQSISQNIVRSKTPRESHTRTARAFSSGGLTWRKVNSSATS